MARRGINAVEIGALVALFAWLLWIPLPFGSNVPFAWLPLLAVPLATCAIAAFCRYAARSTDFTVTSAWSIWICGAAGLMVVGLLQLVPIPPRLLAMVSNESLSIWRGAARAVSIFGVDAPAFFPVSVDPSSTAAEVLRLAGLTAAFVSGSLLIREHGRRVALALVLCLAALFQVGYGVREVALQRYEIWGWKNVLVHSRLTGTFVNPNHLAHYLAMVLPMALFLAAVAWHQTGDSSVPLKRRMVSLAETQLLSVGLSMLAATAIFATILLSRSRGAALALAVAASAVAAILTRRLGARVAWAAGASVLLAVLLIVYLGGSRTVERFRTAPAEDVSAIGRREGLVAAARLWRRFPLLGSGLGTFQSVVAMEQREDRVLYHRAHNDYAEIAATSGVAGFAIALASLAFGLRALVRMAISSAAADLSWRRRAFHVAALVSLGTAMVHGLFDFNFFIPSNPATLAVILGAAVAPLAHDIRSRR